MVDSHRIFARRYMILINGLPLNITLFPDNTSQVWKIPEEILKSNKVEVTWKFLHESEFLHLAQLKSLLDKHQISTVLNITYLPYARQDKEVTNTSTFALRTFANLLNSLRFNKVIVLDPHSSIALDLIANSDYTYPITTLLKVIDSMEVDLFCYPDKGAVSKYVQAYDFHYIYGEKVRDQLTGNITSYKLIGDPKDKKVLIVDDICDGGMTFKLLTKDLLAAGAKEVNLFVTHGIFSKGLKTLKESGIKQIFTQDGEAKEYQNQIIYRRL